MTHGEVFGTALNCMDGRCQQKVNAWTRERFGVTVVDTITEPGMDLVLSGEPLPEFFPPGLTDWVREKARISSTGHGSTCAVVVGHLECAGNQCKRDGHERCIRASVETVRGWGMFERVIGVLVNETWDVEVIEDAAGTSTYAEAAD